MIGRGKAVCQVRGVELSGRPAFAMYLGIHLTYLSGVRGRRLRVLSTWGATRFGTRESWVLEDGPSDKGRASPDEAEMPGVAPS